MAVVILIAMGGCFSSHYTPRGRRVSLVIKDGQSYYSRDGKLYAVNIFGSGLQRAVQGNADAERAARTFRRRTSVGALMLIGGVVCTQVPLFYSIVQRAEDPGYTWTDSPALVGVMIGCTVVALVGGVTMSDGMTYQSDAINIFNDGIDAAVVAPYPPPPRREVRPPLPEPSPP